MSDSKNSEIKDKDTLRQLFADTFGFQPEGFESLPRSGGDRRYYHFKDSGVLGVVADNLAEAKAYVELSQVFVNERKVNPGFCQVPQVYAHTENYSHYLVEDIGRISLFDKLKDVATGDDLKEVLIGRALNSLVSLQTLSESKWASKVEYSPFSRRLIMWDLNYFKYEFLKNADIEFDENELENDFEKIADDILQIPGEQWGFMMRDCQSRNILLRSLKNDGECPDYTPVFIDFQGGRKGPMLYDAVSLLWQAKAGFSEDFRKKMIYYYSKLIGGIRGIETSEIERYAGLIALFRTLQVLGAYGFRGLVQKRAHFLESIPGALNNLKHLLDEKELASYPQLELIAGRLVSESRFVNKEGANRNKRLLVKVFSFSYKRGYPEDLTGNGGGFMFDCRGMHNPGRYDEYKPLTGRDEPVIQFLKSRGEADIFAAKAVDIVSPTVERYVNRGFSSLQIGFGCTGGQHRSVYCAEVVAHALAKQFPMVDIKLIHREQHIEDIIEGEVLQDSNK
ncbi:MAG: phosphotransferase [Bacteroides sp.]|nr:phosphotransferase [Bacteroides sp.]